MRTVTSDLNLLRAFPVTEQIRHVSPFLRGARVRGGALFAVFTSALVNWPFRTLDLSNLSSAICWWETPICSPSITLLRSDHVAIAMRIACFLSLLVSRRATVAASLWLIPRSLMAVGRSRLSLEVGEAGKVRPGRLFFFYKRHIFSGLLIRDRYIPTNPRLELSMLSLRLRLQQSHNPLGERHPVVRVVIISHTPRHDRDGVRPWLIQLIG